MPRAFFYFMSKSFLITSHTEGVYPFEQRTILNGLVKSLKQFFPDCFIVVASQSQVDVDTQLLADYVIVDRKTENLPYGAGEIGLLQAGLNIMAMFGRKDCYKIVYDFLIDQTNYQVFDQWLEHKKEFVGCYWKVNGVGLGSWCWYGTIDFQQQLIDFGPLDNNLEIKLLESAQTKGLLDRCYIYNTHELMFNNAWHDRCDLVHAGGSILKHRYGAVLAVLEITDESESYIPLILQSLANQTKLPNHLVLVESRRNPADLRTRSDYQDLFSLLSQKQIPWNLIYKVDSSTLLKYLAYLGHEWCWLIPNQHLLNADTLKCFYRKIMLDYNIGTISDTNNNLFYRNKIINNDEVTTPLHEFVINKMKETCYTNQTVISK
jgi:hypothetical protein